MKILRSVRESGARKLEPLRERLHDEKGEKLPGSSFVRRLRHALPLLTKTGLPVSGAPREAPDFIVIGSTRCGSTSIYHYLSAHPCIAPAVRKEIHFFDNHYRKGAAWYRSQFPSLAFGRTVRAFRRREFATGESTPYYLFHPLAARRIAETAPSVKLIALLRDPVERAWGDYNNKVARGFETRSFEDALALEAERVRGEEERLLADDGYYSFAHQHFTSRSTGIDADQLVRWLESFPREQLLVVRSEDLYADPIAVTRQVTDFLGLPDWLPRDTTVHHRRAKAPMKAGTRRELTEFYRPHNARLAKLLGVDLGWSS